MIQDLREWWHFILRPNLAFRKTSGINRAFLILLVLQCLLSLLSILIPSTVISNFEKLEVEDMLKDYKDVSELIFVVIGLAFLEEAIFRLPLAPFRVRYLLPSSLMVFFLAYAFKGQFWMQVVLGLSGVLAVVGMLGLFYQYRSLVQEVWSKAFRWVFYLFALIFALVHVSNYDFSQQHVVLWQIPLLVIPQFLAGLTFGYVRISMGFLNGVAMHAAYNAVFLLPAFWSAQ